MSHVPRLLPTQVSPDHITVKNFGEHLGDEKYVCLIYVIFPTLFIVYRYYDAYLSFFTDYLQHNSPTKALEHFIFSPSYNFISDSGATEHDSAKHPQMLNRLFAGLVHPLIHIGYGIEFGILGQVAEGMYQ